MPQSWPSPPSGTGSSPAIPMTSAGWCLPPAVPLSSSLVERNQASPGFHIADSPGALVILKRPYASSRHAYEPTRTKRRRYLGFPGLAITRRPTRDRHHRRPAAGGVWWDLVRRLRIKSRRHVSGGGARRGGPPLL